MPDIHGGMQNKLSKTMGSPLDIMGEIIRSQFPIPKEEVPSFCLINCFFLLFPSSSTS